MLKKYYKALLILIFIIAVVLRWIYIPQGAISFAYDQARDAFLVQEMLTGDLKILGPPVSGVPGLYHGVFYYYVIAPAYFLGQGSPFVVAYWLSLISSLGVFVVYYLAYLLTKKVTPALVSALFFAFSYESTQYANLLTNASMGAWFTPVIYLGLYLWINKLSKWAPVITGMAFGLAVQSEVALAYHLVPIVFWLIAYKHKIIRKEVFLSLFIFIVAVSTMVLSEVKFGFTSTSGLFYILTGGDAIASSMQLGDYLLTVLNQSGKTFAYSIFPINVVFGGLVGFLLILTAIRGKEFWGRFLATYIFAYTIALPFGGSNMKHILVGVAPAVCILLGIMVWKFFAKQKYFFVFVSAVVIFSNLAIILKENINGQTIFPLQGDLVLSKEIAAVDYTYTRSAGDVFSISTLTSPLYVNTLWSYLYNWYGQEKYGYLPYWIGRDQIGQLGNNLQFAPGKVSTHFYIIEPTYGIPELWVGYAKGDQDSISNLVEKKNFGQIVVEQRTIKDEN